MKVVWSETLEREWEQAQLAKWRRATEQAPARAINPGQFRPKEPPVSPVRQQLIRKFGSELAVEAAIRRHQEWEREQGRAR